MLDDAPVVILTGAAGGLGRVMSLALLEAGARVAAVDVPAAADRLAALAAAAGPAAARLHAIHADITSEASCTAAVGEALARFGRVDALVNNAAIFPKPPGERTAAPPKFFELAAEDWKRALATNVNGAFYLARIVAPQLLASGWGRIVNVVTSYNTMNRGGLSPYGPSKAALEAATAVWSDDLAGTQVTVNALLPGGAADTPMVPPSERPDRSGLIAPGVMAAPIVWLISRASDGCSGYRFVAKDWIAGAEPAENVRRAGSPAAWRTAG